MSQGFSAGAIKHNPLIIPVNVFSRRDCHFCVSYAVDEAALGRGLDVACSAGSPREETDIDLGFISPIARHVGRK
jgi:hypothetical protein